MFWPQRSSIVVGMFETDANAGYRLKADFENEIRVPEYRVRVRTDAEAYRIPVDAPPTDDRPARILCIGDSFTFGVGVDAEDAFPERLEARLQSEWPGTWAVRNGGVGGYGPLRSVRRLEADQGAWDPDLVVHTLYLGNDLEDSDPDLFLSTPVVRNGRMVSPGRSPWEGLRFFLRTRSHLYAFLREAFYDVYVASGLADRGRYVETVGQREWPRRVEDVTFPAAVRSVVQAHDWCEAHGARYLLVVAPTAWQVEDDRWEAYRRVSRLPDEALDRDRSRREVLAALREQGIETLDLWPTLRDTLQAGHRPYFRSDAHWTVAGHAAAARAIHERLGELGWVGPGPDGASSAVARAPGERGQAPF
jgi:lysophospholipase L1-like esterase